MNYQVAFIRFDEKQEVKPKCHLQNEIFCRKCNWLNKSSKSLVRNAGSAHQDLLDLGMPALLIKMCLI